MAYDGIVNSMMEKAVSFMQTGRCEEALKYIEKALEYEPDDPDIWLFRAATLRRLGSNEEAIKSCEVALGYDSRNAEAWGIKGGALCDLGRYQEAIKLYEVALRYQPDYTDAWFGKGAALCEMGRYEESIRSFDVALKYSPAYAEAWYGKGYALAKLGRHGEALKFYEAALRYAPDLLKAQYGKGDTIQILGLSQKNLSDVSSVANELKTILKKALKAVWEVKNALGTFDLYLCSTAISDIAQSLLKIGYLQEAKIVGEEALKVIPKIREQDENSRLDPLHGVFKTLLLLGKTEDALRLTQEISSLYRIPLTDEEQSSMLRLISGSLAEDIGDFDKATQVAHQIRNPQVKEYALGDICKALANIGHTGKAIELAQETSDDSPNFWRSFYLGEICRILCEKQQLQEALNICRTISIEAPSFRQSALFTIAEGLARKSQIHEVKTILRQALDIHYEDSDWSLSRASEVLALAGEFDESLETAKKISGSHKYARTLSVICGALTARGQVDRALEIAHGLENEGLDSEALCRISQALAETGHIRESKEIAWKIGDDDKRSDALSCVGKTLAKEGKALEAFETIEKLPKEYAYRMYDTLDTLIKTLASSGRVDEAIQTSAMYDSIGQIKALADIYLAIQPGKSSEGQQRYIDE